jgi:penicillin-binding protein 2
VLWEHGNWGNNSAKLAAQVVDAYVNKQRAKAGNLQKVAEAPAAPAVQTPKLDEAPAGIGGVAPATPAGR